MPLVTLTEGSPKTQGKKDVQFIRDGESLTVRTDDFIVATNYAIPPYAYDMVEQTLRKLERRKDFLVLGHGLGCLTGHLYGKLLAAEPFNRFLVESVEINREMLDNQIDLRRFPEIRILNCDAIELVEHTVLTYDAILYDLFLGELSMVMPPVGWWDKLTAMSNRVVVNVITHQDVSRLIQICSKIGARFLEIAGLYGDESSWDPIPSAVFWDTNRIAVITKNSDDYFSNVMYDAKKTEGCFIDFRERVILHNGRPYCFDHWGTINKIPLLELLHGKVIE